LGLKNKRKGVYDPYLLNLSKFSEGLTIFFLFFYWFSSFFFLSHFLAPFSFPLASPIFSQDLNYLSLSLSLSLTHTHTHTHSQGPLYWYGLGFHWEGGRKEKHADGHATATDNFGKRKAHLLSRTCIYNPY